MTGRFANVVVALVSATALLAASPFAATSAWAQDQPPPAGPNGLAGYEVISRNDSGLEIRFHNMPFKDVHADDAQNALAVDFLGPIDSAPFDKLAADFPEWIAMAYGSYDSGVIRATRPVTFLTRAEGDGFSLRIVPRDGAAPPPPGPLALRGQVDGPPGSMERSVPVPQGYAAGPPPPMRSSYDAYGAIRNYDSLELAVHRGDPLWRKAYERASLESDSELDFSGAYHAYHGGDRVIASQAHAKLALGGGFALIGSVYDTDAHADKVRAPDGSFTANLQVNKLGGAGGLAWDTGSATEVTLEATEQNNITGGRLNAYTGNPDRWWQASVIYHQADMDTPEAILNRGLKDEASISGAQHWDYGIWGSLAARADNYGVHGDARAVKTAGWDGNLRWSADFGGLLAGLSYDGHGEYLLDHANFTGAAPTPYVPLSLRTMETHAVTASLSSQLWSDAVWFDLYGGYVTDRYANDGALYGASLRFHPMSGIDLALGVRHSTVSLLQGETGAQTTAGATLTLGFDGVPLSGYF